LGEERRGRGATICRELHHHRRQMERREMRPSIVKEKLKEKKNYDDQVTVKNSIGKKKIFAA